MEKGNKDEVNTYDNSTIKNVDSTVSNDSDSGSKFPDNSLYTGVNNTKFSQSINNNLEVQNDSTNINQYDIDVNVQDLSGRWLDAESGSLDDIREPVINTNSSKKYSKKIFTVLIILCLLIIGGIIAAYILFGEKNNYDAESKQGRKTNEVSRTIMIYMSPNNLEYDSGYATKDLTSIYRDMYYDLKDIDLESVKVIVYTGGTLAWKNDYISNEENGLFELTNNGFKKIKYYPQHDMGDSENLLTLLNYGYNNYKTDKYDLIIYGHGSAILGVIYDDFVEYSHLEISDLDDALSKSKFNTKNKLELVIFRSCLNGTIEIADMLSKYADYMIASEEVSYANLLSPVLGFIGDINKTDNAIDIGKNFINNYASGIEKLASYETKTLNYTYSILDLSKVKSVVNGLNDFFGVIDLNKDFSYVSINRDSLYQYAFDSFGDELFDMVDLYSTVECLRSYSSYDADKLLKSIDELVVYNKSNISSSHGVSIFFPHYNDTYSFSYYYKELYNSLKSFSKYNLFINKYIEFKENGLSSYSPLSNNLIESNNNYVLELTSEEKNTFLSAGYIVFEKISENNYLPVLSSSDYKLDNNKVIVNFNNSLIKITDSLNNEVVYLPITVNKDGRKVVPVTVNNFKSSDSKYWTIHNGLFYIYDIQNKLENQIVLTKDKNKTGLSGLILSNDDYTSIDFPISTYNVLNNDGSYNPDWKSNGKLTLFEVKSNNFRLEKVSLDKNNEYYIVFKISDIFGNSKYSNFLKL